MKLLILFFLAFNVIGCAKDEVTSSANSHISQIKRLSSSERLKLENSREQLVNIMESVRPFASSLCEAIPFAIGFDEAVETHNENTRRRLIAERHNIPTVFDSVSTPGQQAILGVLGEVALRSEWYIQSRLDIIIPLIDDVIKNYGSVLTPIWNGIARNPRTTPGLKAIAIHKFALFMSNRYALSSYARQVYQIINKVIVGIPAVQLGLKIFSKVSLAYGAVLSTCDIANAILAYLDMTQAQMSLEIAEDVYAGAEARYCAVHRRHYGRYPDDVSNCEQYFR